MNGKQRATTFRKASATTWTVASWVLSAWIATPVLALTLSMTLPTAANADPPARAADHATDHAAGHAPYIDWTPSPVVTKPGQPRGYVQFQMSCAVCHGSGPGKPGSRSLAAKYKGSVPALLEERNDLQATYIKQVVRQGLYVMPFFRKTELSDADLDAIAAYLTRKR
jgi:mono/diheme cytochrome c family protein